MKERNGYHGDLFFWHPSQPGVKLQMLLSCQQLVDGVELGAVAQVLVDAAHLCADAGKGEKKMEI